MREEVSVGEKERLTLGSWGKVAKEIVKRAIERKTRRG